MDQHLVFRVTIHEGVNFGRELQALVCHVTLGDSTRSTAFSVERGKHSFSSTPLQWITSSAHWRRLTSSGQFICRVTVLKKTSSAKLKGSPADQDLTRLGWVVLDLRQAKLNKNYSKDHGEWYPLLGYKQGTEAPRLKISYALEDESRPRVSSPSPDGLKFPRLRSPRQQAKRSPRPSHATEHPASPQQTAQPHTVQEIQIMRGHVTPAVDHVTSPGLAREASSPATYASDFEDEPADPTLRSRSTSQTQQHAADPAAHAAAPQAGTPQHAGTSTVADSAAGHSRGQQGGDARQRAGSAGGDGEGGASRRSSATQLPQGTPPPAAATSAAMEGPVKAFSFSLDIRSFHASQHVPMETCNVFVRATLPKELRDLLSQCGTHIPARLSPLTTRPAVHVPRGVEQPIPNGSGSVEFSCGAMALARLLAQSPRLLLEVWHQERNTADMLLGVASVPLTPLLNDCWVDGLAPVYARVARQHDSDSTATAERVQRCAQTRAADTWALLEELRKKAPPVSTPTPATRERRASHRQEHPSGVTQHAEQQARPSPPAVGHPQHAAPAAATPARAAHAVPLEATAEYAAAYELEVWKREEEAAWRAELREREMARMQLLETEWRRRERAREAEVAAIRAEYTTLETRTREVLASVEERERRLVGLEEAALLRRKDMEREHTARMAEAEAAVRRLQVECEHQLEIERDRYTELSRLRQASEERLALSEARAAALERAFDQYRQQMRQTSEAELSREVLELQDQLRRAQERAETAHKSKQAYKEQVVKLAEQLAATHRQLKDLEDQQRLMAVTSGGSLNRLAVTRGLGVSDLPSGATALHQAAEQQARYAILQQGELAEVRERLAALKASVLGRSSATKPATPAPHATPTKQTDDLRRSTDQNTNIAPANTSANTDGANTGNVNSGNERGGVAVGYMGEGVQGQQASSPGPSQPIQPPPAAPRRRSWGQAPVVASPAAGVAADGRHSSLPQHTATDTTNTPLSPAPPTQSPGLSAARAAFSDAGIAAHEREGAGEGQVVRRSSAHEHTMYQPVSGTAPKPTSSHVAHYGAAVDDTAGLGAAMPSFSAGIAPAVARPATAPTAATLSPQRAAPSPTPTEPPQATTAYADAHATMSSQTLHGNGAIAEIQRLLRRKSELLMTGAYQEDDPLIQRIEARVAELAGTG